MKLPPSIAFSLLCLCTWFIAPVESALRKDELDINKPNREQLAHIIRLNSMLRGVGINAVRLAIVGGQSAGKSSVIEGILGINLPKGDGTQTRVPVEIIASRGDHFVARVGVRNPNEPGTYYKVPQNVTDKADLEKKIREMQNYALEKSGASLSGFSSTPVVVDVQDVGLYDLTFVDLPGLIQSSARGDALRKHDEVLKVVETEANKPGTILVQVISAENNINNGQGRHILDQNAGNDRVGVITKPDKLGDSDENPDGVVEEYTRLLQNKFEGLQYDRGWYVVKSPVPTKDSSPETILAERKNELDFFNKNPLWKEIVLNADANKRIGFSNLRHALSVILIDDFNRRKEKYATQLNEMITDLQNDIFANQDLLKKKMEQDLVVVSTVKGALRQEKDFDISVSSIKPEFDVAFHNLRAKVMNDIPGFRLLSYTLNPKASALEAIIPSVGTSKGISKDVKKENQEKYHPNEAEKKCLNKFDYYNMQKNNIYDMTKSLSVLTMSDDLFSILTLKRLEVITSQWEKHGMELNYEILKIVQKAVDESITKKGGDDVQTKKSYQYAAEMALKDVNNHLTTRTKNIIKALIGPYTTDQEMMFVLKEAYAIYFGRALEGNGKHTLKVIKKLQVSKKSVRVAGPNYGTGGIALVAITATLISSIDGILPFLSAEAASAPLLFLVPGGCSLLSMDGSVTVAKVKLSLTPFHMNKSKNQEKLKSIGSSLQNDLRKIVKAFSENSHVQVKFGDDESMKEQVFQVWVEETAIADMMAHRLFSNLYMIANRDVVQKFSESFSKRVQASSGNSANARNVQISQLQEKINIMMEKLSGLKETQEALSAVY